MTARLLHLACFAAVVLWLVPLPAPAQSLADVARREAERRKAISTPGKVYTNDNLRPDTSSPPPPPPPPAAAPPSRSGVAAADQTPARTEGAAGEEKKDEAYWRKRLQSERDALSRAQLFAEALQSRINALTADFTARDDPAQRDVIAAERQKALAELDRVKKEIEQHTKAIADIQEEGRRAGVPAGWLR